MRLEHRQRGVEVGLLAADHDATARRRSRPSRRPTPARRASARPWPRAPCRPSARRAARSWTCREEQPAARALDDAVLAERHQLHVGRVRQHRDQHVAPGRRRPRARTPPWRPPRPAPRPAPGSGCGRPVEYPALSRFLAMGRPMIPSPMNPMTCAMMTSWGPDWEELQRPGGWSNTDARGESSHSPPPARPLTGAPVPATLPVVKSTRAAVAWSWWWPSP